MIRLYLVQHAAAVSKEQNLSRPLSDQGHDDLAAVVEFIRPMKISVKHIWHSGKARAIQTARELSYVVSAQHGCQQHEGLEPNDDVFMLEKEINDCNSDLMIVGHLPFLSKLASELLSGSQQANTIYFRQGGVLCLHYDKDTGWQVEWMVVPDMLN